MNKKGETLLEVLIALTLITVSSAATASAIISATQSLSMSKNYLVAQNLAGEAIEAVKNIRDTNWMKFPQNMGTCWLNIQDIDRPEACSSDADKSLAYNANPPYYYSVNFKNSSLVVEKGPDFNDADMSGYALALKNDKYMTPEAGASPSFYRAVKIIDEEKAGGMTTSITVQAIVKWHEGAKLYSISGIEILTNYSE